MPLFLDFHQFDHITIEDVKKGHMADLAIQDKYGVRYLQFWLNEEAGTLFCLIEGPDKESCVRIHQESHGQIACNIQQVEQGMYHVFMGKTKMNEFHRTLTTSGGVDCANRVVLLGDIRGLTNQTDLNNPGALEVPGEAKKLFIELSGDHNGRFYEQSSEDNLFCVFSSSSSAVKCALEVQDKFDRIIKGRQGSTKAFAYRIVVHHGQPLHESGGFFEQTLKQASSYALIAEPNQVVILNHLSKHFLNLKGGKRPGANVRLLSHHDEYFIWELYNATELNYGSDKFNVNEFTQILGISWAKLYRSTKQVLGCSPIEFVKQFRLRKARKLLEEKILNISEVAMEVGYSNPSYFSKLFKNFYGLQPSQLIIK